MPDFSTNAILKYLELPAYITLTLATTSLLLLLLPNSAIATLGLTEVLNHHRDLFGLGCVIGMPLGLAHLIFSPNGVLEKLFRCIKRRRQRKVAVSNLSRLNNAEKMILNYCLFEGSPTIYGKYMDAKFVSLRDKGILRLPGVSQQMNALAVPWTIEPHIWVLISSEFDEEARDRIAGDARFQRFYRDHRNAVARQIDPSPFGGNL